MSAYLDALDESVWDELAAELVIADNELVVQNKEKEKLTDELANANNIIKGKLTKCCAIMRVKAVRLFV